MKTYREMVSDAKQFVPEVSVEDVKRRLDAGAGTAESTHTT